MTIHSDSLSIPSIHTDCPSVRPSAWPIIVMTSSQLRARQAHMSAGRCMERKEKIVLPCLIISRFSIHRSARSGPSPSSVSSPVSNFRFRVHFCTRNGNALASIGQPEEKKVDEISTKVILIALPHYNDVLSRVD